MTRSTSSEIVLLRVASATSVAVAEAAGRATIKADAEAPNLRAHILTRWRRRISRNMALKNVSAKSRSWISIVVWPADVCRI